ncbi:glycosyl transferase family 1 protein [Striga hermonthica]|uniref:Glycosyl transferase family 1 protein n=1 Tax=Striga hermonthica TaxID=68872 RepID=A0A9N7NHJ6_STRHE|nr:glycosyl transferase family 1 protein [Striga hermonthica]
MGSLESVPSPKRDHHLLRSSSSLRNSNSSFNSSSRSSRSRFARFVLCKKIDYLQLICGVAVFFFFVFLFQILHLPGSVTEDGDNSGKFKGTHDFISGDDEENLADLTFLKELDFGEDLKFEPLKIMEKFHKGANVVRESVGAEKAVRFGYRKPKLALVFSDLWIDQHQILMVTVARALLEIGYEIEVISREKGPAYAIWREIGVPLIVNMGYENSNCSVDWLNYDGVLVNSLDAAGFLSCLMQEPFKNVPLLWTIHEHTLATRLRHYVLSGQNEMVNTWSKVFSRATVIIFPNYVLPIAYSTCDPGNYFVIQGSPEEAWRADKQIVSMKDSSGLEKMKYEPNDIVIAIVGSQLSYKGMWLEHAFVLQALHPLFTDLRDSSSRLKITVSTGDSTGNYSKIVETLSLKMGYPKETVMHVPVNENTDTVIRTAHLVIYGSFLDDHSFPNILLKAMCLGKPIIAPDLPTIRKYVSDKVNGYIFPKDDTSFLTQIAFQAVSNGKLSLLSTNIASMGKSTAKNLMASESVEGYASLLENILSLPSEVAVPKAPNNIPKKLKAEWQWHLFDAIGGNDSLYRDGTEILDRIEKQFNNSGRENVVASGEAFSYAIWEEQKYIDTITMRKRREDEELKDRTDQPRGTWDDVYRNARRADRSLHERDEGELERTGQPLCIYEPYFGVGTWPFLHHTSLYRGLGLSTKGRRQGADDIDAPSRLPLLNNAYYREVLGEYGAFFAIANRVDRIHKNAWIGFQSWRATARMKSLSKTAERSLLDAIEARRHGDTLYFWARFDMDQRNPLKQEFWSFCDAINAGNCRFVFTEALKQMYGIKHNLTSLPSMPSEGGTWSVMHSWVLPTKSFMEFVMFSRMFVDALDAKFYDDHQKNGRCPLSLSKDKHCYSRLLELLVNVWAYHSARRMVYVDPETGLMQEQHNLKGRKGQMWVKWFQFSTLKTMDEDLAEEFDSDRPKRHWLWPSTGEIFWQGIYEKERNMRNKEKEKKRQRSKDKIQRIRKRTHQRVLGKYVKPLPTEESNSTNLESKILR